LKAKELIFNKYFEIKQNKVRWKDKTTETLHLILDKKKTLYNSLIIKDKPESNNKK
jgi:hypothetical protein